MAEAMMLQICPTVQLLVVVVVVGGAEAIITWLVLRKSCTDRSHTLR